MDKKKIKSYFLFALKMYGLLIVFRLITFLLYSALLSTTKNQMIEDNQTSTFNVILFVFCLIAEFIFGFTLSLSYTRNVGVRTLFLKNYDPHSKQTYPKEMLLDL